MSAISRTVSNGRNFTTEIRKDIFTANTFCVCCKKEKAVHADHIKPLDWGGKSKRENGLALCGRCHWEKSKAELNMKKSDRKKHVAKWLKIAFTPTGKDRTMKKATIDKNASYAKRINKAKMNARKFPERAGHFHKLAAAARREWKKAR